MKNIKQAITLGALFSLSSIPAQAALVAGWDFSQFFASGLNSTNGATFIDSANSNYSDLNSPSPDISPSYGTIFYDGQFGSDTIQLGTGNDEVFPTSGNLNSNNVQAGDGNPFNDPGSYALLSASGQTFTNDLSLAVKDTRNISIEVDLGAQTASDWEVRFAGKTELGGQTGTIAWSWSTDGSAYNPLGVTSNLNDVDTGFTVDFGSNLDGLSKIYLLAGFTGAASGNLLVDNFGVHGNVVPEPSTYALIFAAFAGIFAVIRRRKG